MPEAVNGEAEQVGCTKALKSQFRCEPAQDICLRWVAGPSRTLGYGSHTRALVGPAIYSLYIVPYVRS